VLFAFPEYVRTVVAMFATLHRRNRLRWGMSQGEAAWRLGIAGALPGDGGR
jgi:hypothetical protein